MMIMLIFLIFDFSQICHRGYVMIEYEKLILNLETELKPRNL